jgi:hypothetical protein
MVAKIEIKAREAASRPEPIEAETPAADPTTELEVAQQALDQAVRLSDAEKLGALIAPGAQLWGPGGQALERNQWLGGYASNRTQQVVIDTTDEATNLFGDTAVTSVVQRTRVKNGRRTVSGHFRITYTWVRAEGAWKLAALQYTPLAS